MEMIQSMQKTLTIISGFSGTLKSTTIKSLNADVVLNSPVKLLMDIRSKYFNKHYQSPVHHFYAQFYALSQLDTSKIDSIVMERCIWDYMYYYNLFYNKYLSLPTDNLKSANEIDHVGIFKEMLKYLPGFKVNIIMLKNDSDKLKNIVINDGESNRREAYKDINEYNRNQVDYLDYCTNIIRDLRKYCNSFELRIITDEYFDKIRRCRKKSTVK